MITAAVQNTQSRQNMRTAMILRGRKGQNSPDPKQPADQDKPADSEIAGPRGCRQGSGSESFSVQGFHIALSVRKS